MTAAPTAGFNGWVKIGLSASPTNKMSGVTGISLPIATAMGDVSNMDAGATLGYEQSLPLLTSGKATINVNHDPSDTNGQLVARAASISKALVYFIFSTNGTNTTTWSGYIETYTDQGAVNAVNKGTFAIRLTGAPTFA